MNQQSVANFKDQNRALQELTRELRLLRAHNLRFRQNDPQDTILMFAEAALTCLVMEHFVRIVVGSEAAPKAPLHNLVEKAVSKDLLRLPWDDQKEGVTKVCDVRNTLLHANYAQAAASAQCSSVEDYFKTQFAGEIEEMFRITDHIMKQVDPTTGRPYPKRKRSIEAPLKVRKVDAIKKALAMLPAPEKGRDNREQD